MSTIPAPPDDPKPEQTDNSPRPDDGDQGDLDQSPGSSYADAD